MAHYAKTAEVRRGIVEACTAAFSESGFHGASMAEIARRAGISHTGLLHHFPRKEDLLTAVLDRQDERSAEYLLSHADISAEADPAAVLHGLANALIERDRQLGIVELSAVLTGEATVASHPAHEHFVDRYRNVRSFVTRLFQRLEEQGRISTTMTPRMLASMLIALLDGLHTQWLFERDVVDVGESVRSFLETIITRSAPQPDADDARAPIKS